jgi:hypothetical protein
MDLSAEHCEDGISGLERVDGWNQREIAAMWAGNAVPNAIKPVAGRPARNPARVR